MILRKNLISFFLTLIIVFSYIQKSFSIEPDVFVQSTVNRASEALGGNFTKKEKLNKLKIIAKDTVDIRGMGFYILGKHRKNITPEQKKEYEYFVHNIRNKKK